MTHRTIAAALAALTLACICTIAAPSASYAQADACCLRVNNNTPCPVELCARFADGAIACVLIPAGAQGERQIRCPENPPRLFLRTACGEVPIELGTCVRVRLVGGCCAEVCVDRVDGCLTLRATAIDGPCPCD